MSNYGRLLYLNPQLQRTHGVSTVAGLRQLLSVNPAVPLTSNAVSPSNVSPYIFFATNAQSRTLNLISVDSDIRATAQPANTSNGVLVPNIFASAVIGDSNRLHVYTTNTAIESNHLAPGYTFRVVYPSGANIAVRAASVTRVSAGQLDVVTVQSNLVNVNLVDATMNCVIQGIYVTDPSRCMNVAAARYATVSNINTGDFNAPLYRLLYPTAASLTDPNAFIDYVVASNYSGIPRIGRTADIAVTSTALNQTVPNLSVTGTLGAASVVLGSAMVTGVSRDYISTWQTCSDSNLVSEAAIKRFADRTRNVTMFTGVADNLIVNSNISASNNLTVRGDMTASNARLVGMSSDSIVSVTGTFSNIASSNIQSLSYSARELFAQTAAFSNLSVAAGTTVADLGVTGSLAVAGTVSGGNAAFGNIAGNAIVASNGITAQGAVITGDVAASGSGSFGANLSVTGNFTSADAITRSISSGPASFGNVSVYGAVAAASLSASNATIANVASVTAQLTSLSASNATLSALSVDALTSASSVIGSATASSIDASNLKSDRISSRTAVLSMVSTCNIATSNVTSAGVTSSNLLCSNAVIGGATVSGRLDVYGMLTFPSSTYVSTSNIHAQTVLVDGSGSFESITSDTVSCTNMRTSRLSITGTRMSSRRLRKVHSNTQHVASLLGALHVDRDDNGCPVLGDNGMTDRELLAICVAALQETAAILKDAGITPE